VLAALAAAGIAYATIPDANGVYTACGYEIDSANVTGAAAGRAVGDPMVANLACPNGKKVLSGGEGGDWGPPVIGAQSSDGTSWNVSGSVLGDSFSGGLYIWAICATA
jgi:hypothetical protein